MADDNKKGRVLAGTIHLQQPDGDYVTVLAGTPEADAKKVRSEVARKWGDHADAVIGPEWGNHVWASDEPAGAHNVVARPDDK